MGMSARPVRPCWTCREVPSVCARYSRAQVVSPFVVSQINMASIEWMTPFVLPSRVTVHSARMLSSCAATSWNVQLTGRKCS